MGDQHISRMLAHAPAEADGIWPSGAVRGAIDLFPSADIERGVVAGLIEKRGPTWRAADDGGDQERELAAKYRRSAVRPLTLIAAQQSAEDTQLDWPRTSALLERIAQFYEGEGQREDEDVKRQDWS